MDDFYAHTDPQQPGKSPKQGAAWHRLEDHLRQTADLCRKFASVFNAGDWGYIAGLLHDVGKYSLEFQKRLLSVGDNPAEQIGHVDHSTYGAQRIYKLWGNNQGIVLAYVISGHHSGLPDGQSQEQSCLAKRLNKELNYQFRCPADFFALSRPALPFSLDSQRYCFEISFFIRMLFSCLVDGDFLDTEKHMSAQNAAQRLCRTDLSELKGKLDARLRHIESQAPQTRINRIRSQILSDCLKAARQPQGLFSLTVPTGGGKTLSSMAFALEHAIHNQQQRIIYVIPYTSIIEQNAGIFRSIFGDAAVLEHHSNFEPLEENSQTRLAIENWDAPIVATTNVQFFESLFSNRVSRCRRLHHIANSVIVLDEVQSLPSEFLLPCLEAIRELVLHYHCSIILCSATQPAILARDDFKQGLKNVREIMSNPSQLYYQLKRVSVHYIGRQSEENLSARLKKHCQVLCIVNTRNEAQAIFESLKDASNCFHLSAAMCPKHRSKVLQEIKAKLQEGQECRLISTQVIEAGVDIDFPAVYRAIAGLDSIAQAAGRCNREGRLDKGDVFVFEPPKPLPCGFFRQTAQTAAGIIQRFAEEMLSLQAIEEYFKEYYWKKGEQLDKEGILSLIKEGATGFFPFRQISEKFKLIDQERKPVIIPFDPEAQEIIEHMRAAKSLSGFSRKLQKYTVDIQPRFWENLRKEGAIEMVREMFPVLVWKEFYDMRTGLNDNTRLNPDPNSLIF